MKRLYISIALIIVAVLICIVSGKATEKNSLQMRNELHETGKIIVTGNLDDAAERLTEVEKTWRKTETLFSFIVDADKIEEMNVGFSMISAHINDGNKEHALERLRECELLLEEINENEKLNIKNIM